MLLQIIRMHVVSFYLIAPSVLDNYRNYKDEVAIRPLEISNVGYAIEIAK